MAVRTVSAPRRMPSPSPCESACHPGEGAEWEGLRAGLLRAPRRHPDTRGSSAGVEAAWACRAPLVSSHAWLTTVRQVGACVVRPGRWREGLKRGWAVGMGSAPLDGRTGTATEVRSVAPMSRQRRKWIRCTKHHASSSIGRQHERAERAATRGGALVPSQRTRPTAAVPLPPLASCSYAWSAPWEPARSVYGVGGSRGGSLRSFVTVRTAPGARSRRCRRPPRQTLKCHVAHPCPASARSPVQPTRPVHD